MAVPEKYKKEIVLSFRYKRLGNEWKRATDEPGVLRIGNRDCSQEFCEPVLVGNPAAGFVEVRIYDEEGIDITNDATLLGDWARAGARCDRFLESQAPKISGSEHVAVQ